MLVGSFWKIGEKLNDGAALVESCNPLRADLIAVERRWTIIGMLVIVMILCFDRSLISSLVFVLMVGSRRGQVVI